MIEHTINSTKAFLDTMPKSKRKKIGQFFTSKETAVFMAELFDLNNVPSNISILDPGAGTGVLSAALIQRLESIHSVNSVHLVCYENNPDVIPILKENLLFISSHSKKEMSFCIREEDYLLSQSHDFEGDFLSTDKPPKYDLIIGNPPYLRILKSHAAAVALPSVVHGAPNLYFLFSSMALFNLKAEAEMVFIIPRSWTSGAYFKSFREYFLSHGKLQHIHLFVSRDKVFSEEQVLQETIIVKLKKTSTPPNNITITSTQTNSDFNDITTLTIPYSSVVNGPDLYVFLPTNQNDINTINTINMYSQTLTDIGVRMRTGIVVDFREWESLRKDPGEENIPLFYSQHIKDCRVNHDPSGKDYDWLSISKLGLTQDNKDYIFCKRFTAKEEKRRLQCGIYLSEDFPEYEKIGTQNKINYIERIDRKPFEKKQLYGLFALFNSTLFDNYYRILNGSTQVNSTEINTFPVPPLDEISKIGELLMASGNLSTEFCDKVIFEISYNK